MRDLILSTLLLASALQTALGEQDGDWTYSVIDNKATVTSYSGAGGVVTIPSTLGGYPVTAIADSSPYSSTSTTTAGGSPIFGWNNNTVTSVTIPNSVTTIGAFAFGSCSRLASINLPNTLTIIGELAFVHCSSRVSVSFPNTLTIIGYSAFYGCSNLASITIPNSVTFIGRDAFANCAALTSLAMPDKFIAQVGNFGFSGQVATDYLVNALANNDAFVTAVANKIKATGGNYGIATQTGLSSAITTATEPLATKAQITTAINEGKAAGIASVTSSPSTWSMFTSSEVQNMSVGDLVLTRDANGLFVLNYDIQQSEDLQNWTTYQEYALPLTNLPINKAFVRIKAIEGTQEALLDAKINGTISYINWYKSAAVNYYRSYNSFSIDGVKYARISGTTNAWTRTYGDGATLANAANTTFGDILISEGMLDRLMLPIGEYGYSNPVGYTAGAISLAQNGVAKAKPVNTAGVNYPLILCRNYVDSSAETRLFTASANSSRVVFILIPGLSTTEVAALKTKIDGPFNNTILGASDLVAKAVAGTATGNTAEYVNRGNCLITTSPLAGGRYDAWVYLVND